MRECNITGNNTSIGIRFRHISTYIVSQQYARCVVCHEQSRFFYMNRDPKLKPEVLNRDNNC